MMLECMLKKKKKKAMMDVKQQSPFLGGVLTRSRALALQRLQKESGEFGSRRFKKVAAASASGEVKKRQRRGSSCCLLKGEGGNGRKRRGGVVGGEERVGVEEGENKVKLGVGEKGKDDLGCAGVLNATGGVSDTVTGSGGGGDMVVGGGVADTVIGGGGAKGCEGEEKGGDCILGDDVLVIGGNDRVTRESTPEHLIIRSDCIRSPCSSTKGAKPVAGEKPQIEVGGNTTQHKQLTADLLLQDNSNYAPSMEKYNFDFENEKPLPGRFEWEKIQP